MSAPASGSGLVSTEWLQAHLDDRRVLVIEASVEKATCDAAHIPGARWVDVHRELLFGGDDSSGHPVPAEEFAALMGRLGVSAETTVVWYGDRHSSLAIRGFWTMQFYRHAGANHVLDGGHERWIAEGRAMTADVPVVTPARYPVPERVDASGRATLDEVRGAIGQPETVVLDVRSRDEYTGANKRAARGGHIPGAVHIEWTDATDAPNVLKSANELRALYASRGVTPEKEIIAHCQLGIRSAHTWFVLKHVLGYPNVRSYDGSWQEWGNRDDTPIER
jgi:thiosulfate/3-mercaptopyruvate sulfurtransferase